MKKFFIKSFGCQYNEWDAARLSFVLKNVGMTEDNEIEAEIIFLLNCSVRKTGVDRVMSFTKNYIKSGKKVIVSGCILSHDRAIFEKKGAILWDGESVSKLLQLLDITDKISTTEGNLNTNLVPIIKGCNNFCSYCAVPYTRGREISRSVDEICNDIKRIVASGGTEIILLGQNVNSYMGVSSDIPPLAPSIRLSLRTGSTLRGGETDNYTLENASSPLNLGGVRGGIEAGIEVGFAELLRIINDIPGDFVIKFTSNHPKDMTDDIIKAIATLPKVAKEIHLPLQSGSNKILKLMNRPYTREQYLSLIEKIVQRIPNIKISTDTIVGFPSEDEEDFQQTVEIFKLINFTQAFNNKYSPRSGTKAFELGDPISWEEKQRRWRILNELSYKK